MGGRGATSASGRRYSLGSSLVERADGASALGNAGQMIEKRHSRYLGEIDGMTLSAQEKEGAKARITELAVEALTETASNPSWTRTGRARIDAGKSKAGADRVAKANNAMDRYVDSLREKDESNRAEAARKRRASAIERAIAAGELSVTIDGKTYVRKSRRSKSFTLKE